MSEDDKKKEVEEERSEWHIRCNRLFSLQCNVSVQDYCALAAAISCGTVVFYLFETFEDSYQILKIVEKPDKCKLGKRIIPHTHTHTHDWCNASDERERKNSVDRIPHSYQNAIFVFVLIHRPSCLPLSCTPSYSHTSHILTLDTMLPCTSQRCGPIASTSTDTADKQYSTCTASYRIVSSGCKKQI